MEVGVIIVAAGRGERFGGGVPKQFRMLGGKQVVEWSVEAFRAALPEAKIIVVAPEEYVGKLHYTGVEVCAGGMTRGASVRTGLAALDDVELVAVHDGARPYISAELIERCISAAAEYGSAVPALKPTDTLRWLDGGVIDRTKVVAVQTPQVFRAEALRRAYDSSAGEFTDDASLFDSVHIIDGDPKNIKITYSYEL